MLQSIISISWKGKHWILNPQRLRNLKTLEHNQYLSVDELQSLTWEKQKRLVAYAYDKVPFYRMRFNSIGLHPKDLQDPEDFSKIPLLTKDEVRANLSNMIAEGINQERLKESRTGGSTGTPLKVYHDMAANEIIAAIGVRMLHWWHVEPWMKIANTWRVTADNEYQEFRSCIKHGRMPLLSRDILLNAVDMTPEVIGQFLSVLHKFKPSIISGYVGAVNALAEYVIEHDLVGIVRPKAVWVTSAPVFAALRKNMEEAFLAPVYDQYGSSEIYWLAAECLQREGLHIFSDVRYIEFLDDAGNPTPPNTQGRIVVTDLENYAAPMIRYLNGDMGSLKLGLCSCGKTLPLMNSVTGRSTDMIIMPDGSQIAGDYFTTVLDDYVDEVAKFQVHQKSLTEMDINMVLAKPEEYQRIVSHLKKRFERDTRGQIHFNFNQVNDIPHDSGKYRYVRSDVTHRSGVYNHQV